MTARDVVVIGGGLAGITAAITLREAGADVTLLEARPWLGGATSSFSRGGLKIDTGQHVFLRCCTSYRELLARLGVTGSATLQDRFDVTVLAPGGGRARLRRSALPAPLHLGRALVGYGFLSLPERLRVGRAALALRTLDPARPGLDGQRLGDWLGSRGQTERARRRLWDLFIVSSLNIDGDEASVPLAATVLKTALLGDNDAADIGVPAVPLGELHGQAAAALLGRLGADVRLGTKATAVEADLAGGFRVQVSSGADGDDGPDPDGEAAPAAGARAPGTREISADGVVLAVPAGTAARLASAAGVAGADRWNDLSSSPIVNVHVVYDRRVTRLPFAAAVDSPVQWVFDKTRTSGLKTGQYLAISLSAADGYVDVPAARLRERFLPALEELFPAARDARVTDFFVTRERRATFRQAPGCAALRPGAATSLPGLVLAGAWTDTGWPDTMEGAVRSGRTAAQELIQQMAGLAEPAGTAGPARAAAGSPS
ncbi:MAG TPA: hydroxysqualene dehydroxylase HpnE [Streptosporangiaceae bacterium]|nr:hydroxysqualene dehydroxylase HpnE [Streptosporangiaceae bacterium]